MNDQDEARAALELENLTELDSPIASAARRALAGDPDLFDGKVHVIVGRPKGTTRKARRVYPTKDRRGVTLLERNAAGMKSWETWELDMIVRPWARRRSWLTWEEHPGGFDITPGVVGKEYRVDRELLTKLNRVAVEAQVVVDIVSGWRSYAKQLQLWLLFLAGLGNPANRPGTSNHEGKVATAADVYVRGIPFWTYVKARPALLALAIKLGLTQPHSHEPWHVEFKSTR